MTTALTITGIVTAIQVGRVISGEHSLDDFALLVSLSTVIRTLAALLWPELTPTPPEDLAATLAATIEEEWREEAHKGQLSHPGVLPLAWASTSRAGIADDPARALAMDTSVRVRHVRIRGRLKRSRRRPRTRRGPDDRRLRDRQLPVHEAAVAGWQDRAGNRRHGGFRAGSLKTTVLAIRVAGYRVDPDLWPASVTAGDCTQCHAGCHDSPTRG